MYSENKVGFDLVVLGGHLSWRLWGRRVRGKTVRSHQLGRERSERQRGGYRRRHIFQEGRNRPRYVNRQVDIRGRFICVIPWIRKSWVAVWNFLGRIEFCGRIDSRCNKDGRAVCRGDHHHHNSRLHGKAYYKTLQRRLRPPWWDRKTVNHTSHRWQGIEVCVWGSC